MYFVIDRKSYIIVLCYKEMIEELCDCVNYGLVFFVFIGNKIDLEEYCIVVKREG